MRAAFVPDWPYQYCWSSAPRPRRQSRKAFSRFTYSQKVRLDHGLAFCRCRTAGFTARPRRSAAILMEPYLRLRPTAVSPTQSLVSIRKSFTAFISCNDCCYSLALVFCCFTRDWLRHGGRLVSWKRDGPNPTRFRQESKRPCRLLGLCCFLVWSCRCLFLLCNLSASFSKLRHYPAVREQAFVVLLALIRQQCYMIALHPFMAAIQ